MKNFVSLLSLFILAWPAFAETVQTTDGRTIELKSDGSYEFLESKIVTDATFVEYKDHYFVHHAGEYGQNRVRFMPVFENISGKKIIAAKFTAKFSNAFGDEIFSFSGELNEAIATDKSSTHNLFYYFEDNQFMSGEPYDKLLPMVTNNSGNVEVTLDMIAFEGGEIVKLTE
ncbi:hypothetical protein [Sulfitobacter sp.]|uniref:hypothetical protein n=1 Tax=Sulfitobacter sp. TaxID=1903071 RepID=UPI0030019931